MNAVQLDIADLSLAALLVLVNAALSLAFALGLERRMLLATARMVVQLLLVGAVLKALFAAVSPLWTGVAALAMVLFAGREVMARQERRLKGVWAYGLGTSSMLLAAVLVTVFALSTQVRPDPWYDPRYALPLLGMILGNTMTGVSLGLHALSSGLHTRRTAVEAQIALGATRWQATRPVARAALLSALMPIINAMAATGLVSLPGMMTGQILAGADPAQAVRYQMLIMFLIAGGTTLGALAAVLGGVLRLTDARHRLRLDRLRAPRSG
ncbi:MAG: iron export ABC transporter permease subunit FetB [Planctomycetes bacterium]|nr:iron export ABC transporter permease subunit FetB [Planctomycetota bacterium]